MKKIVILYIFSAIAVVFIFALLAQRATSSDSTIKSDRSLPEHILIETTHMGVLPPHMHEMTDSLSQQGHHHNLMSEMITFPEDVWITDITFDLHNAPAAVLHHASIIQLNKPSNTCPDQPKELVNVGADVIYDKNLSFPAPYGIFVEAGAPLLFFTMIHNPAPPVGIGGTYEDVYMTADVAYEPANKTGRDRPIEFYLLHVADASCSGENYDFAVPANTERFLKRQDPEHSPQPGRLVMSQSGDVLYTGAHLHGWQGGRYLRVYQNGELFETFETKPSTENKRLWETAHGPQTGRLNQGDMIEIEAEYTNPSNDVRIGAMGMYGLFFAPDKTESE